MFWRRASEQVQRGISQNKRTREGGLSGHRRRRSVGGAVVRAAVESLENRMLLATLPLPEITSYVDISGGTADNDHTPSIAYDPTDTQRLVTAFVRGDEVVGSFSLDAGTNWTEFAMPALLGEYGAASDPTVAFDRARNFYVVYSEHTAADDYTAGAIVMQKYSLPVNLGATGMPAVVTQDKEVYTWTGGDAAMFPTMLVDNTLGTFTDPTTSAVVTNAYVGRIYVAWASAPVGGNYSRIRMQSSADGGATFSEPVTVSTGNSNTAPRLVVSQGTSDGRVTPGQVTVVWDDYSGATTDTIRSTRITGGAVGKVPTAPLPTATTAIRDATAAVSQNPPDPPTDPDTMAETVSTLTLPTEATFTVTDLDIYIQITHADLSQLWMQLTLPNGTNVLLATNGVTSDNPVQQTGGGLTGADMNFTLDEDAFRGIADLEAGGQPYTGRFNLGGVLSAYYMNRTLANAGGGGIGGGQFRLTIRDYHSPEAGSVTWGIRLNSFTTPRSAVATTNVKGSSAGGTGTVRPLPVVASDNTLGSFSPYQGRLYVAYVGTPNTNTPDNGDIYLAYSDDGGIGWVTRRTNPADPLSAPLRINDDNAVSDGFSEGSATTGRAQVQPAIAVDQTTGTLVVTYLDARYDAARSRFATYVATSIDGGATFGPQTFANRPNKATDAITHNEVVIGPLADHSTANVGAAGLGQRQGLAVVSGRVYPVWTGNQNGWDVVNKVEMTGTHILSALMTIAAGPRVISSTMGPVSEYGDTVNPGMVDGSPQFSGIRVQFDRPIDPSSFDATDINVWYRDTTKAGTDAGDAVAVGSVTALDNGPFGATLFLVTLASPWTSTGTYSYEIWPDYSDRIRRERTYRSPDAPTLYTATATGAQTNVPIPSQAVTTSTVTVAGVPAGKVVGGVTVNVNLTHSLDKDLVLTLISPSGTRVVLARNRGGDTGADFTNTTFDDASINPIGTGVAPFTGTFAPDGRLGAFLGDTANGTWSLEVSDGAAGNQGVLVGWSLSIRTAYAATVTSPANRIPAAGTGGSGAAVNDTITSSLTVAGPAATSLIEHVAVNVRISHAMLSDLTLALIGPDGTRVALATNNLQATGVGSANTTFDDDAGALTSGWVVPEESLSRFVGRDARGSWRLEITDTAVGNTGTLEAWSLDIRTSSVINDTVSGSSGDQDMDGESGQAANIRSNGDVYAIPKPANRGSYNGTFFTAPFDASTLPIVVPGPHIIAPVYVGGGEGEVGPQALTQSKLTVRAGANAKITDLNVQIESLGHTNLSDLALALVGPDGTRVLLAVGVGGAGSSFARTVFDDSGDQAIGAGVAPFTGVYRPVGSLAAFAGKKLAGEWTLEIADGVVANSVTVGRWSLQAKTTDGNLTVNGSVGSIDVMFDRDMDPGSFTADSIVNLLGPAGPVNGPRSYVATQNLYDGSAVSGRIADGPSGVALEAPLTIDEDYFVRDVRVKLNITHSRVSDLTITLLSPTGISVPLVVQEGTGANFTNTLICDGTALRIATGSAPFDNPKGYQSASPLSMLDGTSIRGTWKLLISDGRSGMSGTLNGWSLIATPGRLSYTITGDPYGTDPDPDNPRTFRVGFPAQKASGSYSMTLASSIESAAGEQLDTNLNAGVDALFGRSSVTTEVRFENNRAAAITALSPAESTIEISGADAFNITAGGYTLQLNITYPNDQDLVATLHVMLKDGTELFIPLFDRVGATGLRSNFTDTILDDQATTPIQNGASPYLGRYSPQSALTDPLLVGHSCEGTWTLIVENASGIERLPLGSPNQLVRWSLTFKKPDPSDGLGEAIADQYTTGFRIFTMDPGLAGSTNEWTSVGGATAGVNGSAGRVGALAVDPSDPSGNTVYVGGANGGIWKTTNFLTDDPAGPTYIPLTDFGPNGAMKISSIAVFGRNGNPNDSIIFAATGDISKSEPMVGFLRSMDGGRTWTLLDSTRNVVSVSDRTPLYKNDTARDKKFGITADALCYKIVVDPRPTLSGDVIVYAAISARPGGTTYGIYRSVTTGDTWEAMYTLDSATDVVLDENSGYFDVVSNPAGNLQRVYAAFRMRGVYMSPNRGTVWNQLTGTIGNPLIQDADNPEHLAINVGGSGTPNQGSTRILLAKPGLTGVPVQDLLYQGWLYAVVVTAASDSTDPGSVHDGGKFVGLYLTKDFGQNWTQVRLGSYVPANAPAGYHDAVPTNDPAAADYELVSDAARIPYGQGLYDITLAVDPNDANVVYIGGTTQTGGPGLIRVDTTTISDAHAFFINGNTAAGTLHTAGTDPIALANVGTPGAEINPLDNPYVNLIQNPMEPFVRDATVFVSNVDPAVGFANSGIGAKWTGYPSSWGGAMNQHALVAVRDAATGRTRLIMGDDRGVTTLVNYGDGTPAGDDRTGSTAQQRNGNLQLVELFQGAAQPTIAAANTTGVMFYGMGMNNGYPQSAADVLATGNITWTGTVGSGSSVATDQQGLGTLYQFKWPESAGVGKNFFQVNGVGRTFGLLQGSSDTEYASQDWQWPNVLRPIATDAGLTRQDYIRNPRLLGPNFEINYVNSAFAVNPIKGSQIIIGSISGRIYGTENTGQFWSLIGESTALDGSYASALAYGAPNPNGQGDPDATNFHLYAGTVKGEVFVTFDGGGGGAPGRWISLGVPDSSAIVGISPTPLRHSTPELYLVTNQNVYYRADSSDPGSTWVRITGNLKSLLHQPFGNDRLSEAKVTKITSLKADWRYAIPDNPNDPASRTHPVLYVGTDAGVYRSLDRGTTWTPFPDVALDGAAQAGGYMPNVLVTDLDLALGAIDSTTGQPNVSTGPGVLLATTFGRGSFAIRLAPLILTDKSFPNSQFRFALDPASDRGASNSDGITTATGLNFTGWSQQTAFGNKVRITLLDMEDPFNPVIVGGYDPAVGEGSAVYTDLAGKFVVPVNAGVFATGGKKIIGVRATDDAGVVGPIVTTEVTVDVTAPVVTPAALSPVEGVAVSGVVGSFVDATDTDISKMTATIDWGDGSAVGACTIVAKVGGGYNVIPQLPHTYDEEGTYDVTISVTDAAGNVGTGTVTVTVADQPVIATGGYTFTAVEGAASASQIVATFRDPAGADELSDYSAVIDWGDGSAVSAGTITYNAASGVFTVRGSHTYAQAEQSPYTITVTISHDAAADTITTSTARVSDPAVVVTGGFTMTAQDGDTLTDKVVATFTDPGDPNGLEPLSDYSAVIAWGDGTTSAGVITYDAGSGIYTVRGSHLYGGSGDYMVVTTVSHDSAPSASATSLASITDTPVVPTGGFTITANEGAAFSGEIVASFTDPGRVVDVSYYSATIAWGDGTTSAGVIAFDTVAQAFLVRGGHTYTDEGVYTITTTILHGTTTPGVVTSTANVANVQIVPTGGFTVSAVEGALASNWVVARFTDPGGAEPVSSYSATIDWGDGSSSTGVITYDSGTQVFSVRGSHTYALYGSYVITTTLRHKDLPTVTAASSAAVADVAVAATGGFTISAEEGVNSTAQTVATFTDPGGPRDLAHYAATIAWGDGTTSAGTITYNSATQIFTVSGSHLYADDGTYTVTTTIEHAGAAATTATSSAQVQNALMTPAVAGPAIGFAGKAASFTLTVGSVSGADLAAGFTYAINWGDGSAVETIAASAGNGAGVVVSHSYAAVGSYEIQVTATNRSSDTASASASVEILEATGIGTVAINGGDAQRSSIGTITFQPIYDGQALAGISKSNLKIISDAGKAVSLSKATLSYDAGTATATLDLSNVSLANSNYQLQITLASGVVKTVDFHKLTGDVNGTRAVDFADQAVVEASMGKSTGDAGFDRNADVNGDGSVTSADLQIVQLANRGTVAVKTVTLGLSTTPPKVKAIGFGTFKVNGNGRAIDLVIRNTGTSSMSLKSFLVTDATKSFSMLSVGGIWKAMPKSKTLAAGQSMTVRLYFTTGSVPKSVEATFSFAYKIGTKTTNVSVPLWGVVRK